MKDKTEDLKTLWEEAEFHANILEQDAKKANEAYSTFWAMSVYFDSRMQPGNPTEFDYKRRRAVNEMDLIARRITGIASVARINATEAHEAYLRKQDSRNIPF